jgi:hypothetical protein
MSCSSRFRRPRRPRRSRTWTTSWRTAANLGGANTDLAPQRLLQQPSGLDRPLAYAGTLGECDAGLAVVLDSDHDLSVRSHWVHIQPQTFTKAPTFQMAAVLVPPPQ